METINTVTESSTLEVNQEVHIESELQFSEADEPSCQSMESYEQFSQHQAQTANDFQSKIEALRCVLGTNLLACDAKWTLFVAAALSYRYDSKLIPFPPQFAPGSIDALVSVINDTPKMRVILQNIVDQNYHELSMEVIELLYWVLITMREPALRLVEEEEFLPLLCSIDKKCITEKSPTHVFEVSALTGINSDVAFRNQVSNLPVKLAFLGTKLDSYYSIICNGFVLKSQNKKHIEVTTDLRTCLTRSPNDPAWGASQCGSLIKCAAICEFAYDPDTDKITTNKNDKSCINIQLENPTNIRVRYLLFYGSRFPKRVLPQRRLLYWIYRHKYPLSLISYTLLLISICLANRGSDSSIKLYVTEKFNRLLAFCEGMLRALQ